LKKHNNSRKKSEPTSKGAESRRPRARDALVAARTELINTTRGLVKTMGTRLPKCSSRSFAQKGEEAIAVEMREALLPLMRLATTLSADV
jgi:hypothetical protein